MKVIVLSLLITLSAYAYPHLPSMMPTQVIEVVFNADGTPSKFRLVHLGSSLTILAKHKMRNGFRSTSITDSDGDGKVDQAFVMGVEDENERMFYQRKPADGIQFAAEWQEEWNESKFEIEKLLGRKIQGGVK